MTKIKNLVHPFWELFSQLWFDSSIVSCPSVQIVQFKFTAFVVKTASDFIGICIMLAWIIKGQPFVLYFILYVGCICTYSGKSRPNCLIMLFYLFYVAGPLDQTIGPLVHLFRVPMCSLMQDPNVGRKHWVSSKDGSWERSKKQSLQNHW